MPRVQLPIVGVRPETSPLEADEPAVACEAPFVLVGGPPGPRRREAARMLSAALEDRIAVHEGNTSLTPSVLFVVVAPGRARDPLLRRVEASADLVVSVLDPSLATHLGKCLDAALANHVG